MTAAVPATHGEVWLRARPDGVLGTEHFEVVRVPVPEARAGQVLVRSRLMSVAASMRTLMEGAVGLPLPVAVLGEPLWAPALGEVVAAPGGELAPGDLVTHGLGWREYAAVDVAEARRVDPSELPDPAAYLSQAMTAWLGVVRGAEVRPGDTVFVTGAAAGVGTMAGRFARLRGAGRVIGSTGSRLKGEYLIRESGYDAVVVRGAAPIEEQLREAAPDGLDVVFDNVGGEQLAAALAVARRGARVGSSARCPARSPAVSRHPWGSTPVRSSCGGSRCAGCRAVIIWTRSRRGCGSSGVACARGPSSSRTRGFRASRRMASGHREYGPEDVHRLRAVRKLLEAGPAIGDLLAFIDVLDMVYPMDGDDPGPGPAKRLGHCSVAEVTTRRPAALDERIGRLVEVRSRLAAGLADRFGDVFPEPGAGQDVNRAANRAA